MLDRIICEYKPELHVLVETRETRGEVLGLCTVCGCCVLSSTHVDVVRRCYYTGGWCEVV